MTSRASTTTSALRRVPLSVRLGTAFASVFLVVLTALIALAYWGLGTTLQRELDRALVDVVAQVDDSGLPLAEIDERELGGVESSEIETQVLDRSGAVLDASDQDLRTSLLTRAQISEAVREGVVFTDAHDREELRRVLARPLPTEPGRVQVLAVEMDSVVESHAALLNRAGPLAACAGLLAGLTGWLVAAPWTGARDPARRAGERPECTGPVQAPGAAPVEGRGHPAGPEPERDADPHRGRAATGTAVHRGRESRAQDTAGHTAGRGGTEPRAGRRGSRAARVPRQRARGV